MNDLTTTHTQLPAKIDDLAKFVLIGREKTVALKAEIRAIEKAGLATEVYNQKLEEQRQFSDILLQAEVRMGELTREIPKASGGDRRSEDFKKVTSDYFEKTKQEAIQELGLTQTQVKHFEAMARNPDLVEQARETAAAENRPITRKDVLDLTSIREAKRQDGYDQIASNCKLANKLVTAMTALINLPGDPESIKAMCKGTALVADTIQDLRMQISKLQTILRELERR